MKRYKKKCTQAYEWMQWRSDSKYLSCIYSSFLTSNEEWLRQTVFSGSTNSFVLRQEEALGHKFTNLTYFPCNFLLYQFWLPFLFLFIKTISIWWNDLAFILHNTSSKTKQIYSWSIHSTPTMSAHLASQAASNRQHQVPHIRVKTLKARIITQLSWHKHCKAMEKTSSDLCSFYSGLLNCTADVCGSCSNMLLKNWAWRNAEHLYNCCLQSCFYVGHFWGVTCPASQNA